MEVEVTNHGEISLVRLEGDIVDGHPAELLQSTLRELRSRGQLDTIVDLEGVTWFDSIAIGLLVTHYASVSRRGGRVVLLKADDKIRRLLDITRLSDRFGWAMELGGALAWFNN
jgi:anti-anti-sigma factor